MMLVTWISFVVVAFLTFMCFVLVRRDTEAYVESQVKVLGEENRHHLETNKYKLIFWVYCLVLIFIIIGFGFYLLFLA